MSTLNHNNDLNETQIQENYDYFIEFLRQSFSGERLEGLLRMYAEDQLGIALATAPASTFLHFHHAWPGGYLQHVLHVEKASRGAAKLYAGIGGTIDFTEEERIFAALHHDLGKLGTAQDGPQYIPAIEAWQIKKGQTYRFNDDLQYMTVPDRAFYLLQDYGIKFTWKEMLGIKLADGLFDEATRPYLEGKTEGNNLKTSLPLVINAADFLSCRAEKDMWKRANQPDEQSKEL